MDPLLKVEDLKTHFFTSQGVVKAVDGISFAVKKGGSFGIVGESGSGKSVTALSILRLVSAPGRIVGGRILFDGQDILQLPEGDVRKIRGGRIAIVFQEPTTSLNPVYTIGNQIEEAIRLHQPGLTSQERKDHLIEALRTVHISDPVRVARSYPHELSGGMKQRGMITMALACKPDLLIADEPTTALDVTVQAQVLNLLLEIHEAFGMALVLITHDIGIIAEMVDEVAIMQQGKIVKHQLIESLFAHADQPYTKKLLEIYERFDRR
jgi:peptide/nickel transport system ATP-binding protein